MAVAGKSKGSGLADAANQSARLLGQMVVGGLCGVGAVWTLTALWAPSRTHVERIGDQISRLATHYPAAIIGLVLGVTLTLLISSLKK